MSDLMTTMNFGGLWTRVAGDGSCLRTLLTKFLKSMHYHPEKTYMRAHSDDRRADDYVRLDRAMPGQGRS